MFDILISLFGLIIIGWLIVFLWLFISILSNQRGFFTQKRIGQFGKAFTIYKLRTIYKDQDSLASRIGKFLRKSKLDEFPQLFNVLIGDMSFVGPRPDIEGYYDKLEGEERKILELKPGLTSDASLKYFNEERLLAKQQDPLGYNDTVIFPDKVRMNLYYYYHRSFCLDVRILFNTIFKKY